MADARDAEIARGQAPHTHVGAGVEKRWIEATLRSDIISSSLNESDVSGTFIAAKRSRALGTTPTT